MWTTIATLVFAAAMGTSATEAADNPAITTVDLPAVATPWPGKIVVSNDEWPLSDYGFAVAPDARRFALNLAAWFTGGRPGSFLVYSTNGGLTGFELAETMRGAGHTWHVTTNVGFTLEALLNYDAVFVGGGIVDNNVLIDYVRAGGKVFLVGGTGLGDGTAAFEVGYWNPFLNAFGLRFEPVYNYLAGRQPVPTAWGSSPLFAGVQELYYANGESVDQLDPTSRETQVFAATTGGLFATYDANALPVSVEICPNRFPVERHAEIFVAVSGGTTLDVTMLDPASIRIYGVAPLGGTVVNVSARMATLLAGTQFASCLPAGGAPGRVLVLTFSAPDVTDAITARLGRYLRSDEAMAVVITGRLKAEFGGTSVVGEDVVTPFSNRSAKRSR